jgi:hypothetical protein
MCVRLLERRCACLLACTNRACDTDMIPSRVCAERGYKRVHAFLWVYLWTKVTDTSYKTSEEKVEWSECVPAVLKDEEKAVMCAALDESSYALLSLRPAHPSSLHLRLC